MVSETSTGSIARAGWLMVLIVLVTIATPLVSQPLDEGTVPPGRWTLGDLPRLPPSGENGWQLIQEAADLESARIPNELGALLDVEASWQDVVDIAAELHTHLSLERSIQWRNLAESALARPAFVDGCLPSFATGGSCPVLPMLSAFDTWSLSALALGERGQWEEAWQATERLNRAAYELLTTARSITSNVLAARVAEKGLTVAQLLKQGMAAAAPDLEVSETLMVTLCSLVAVLEFGESDVHLRRAIVFEEMLAHDAIVMLSSEDNQSNLVFDPVATHDLLVQEYEALMRYAWNSAEPFPSSVIEAARDSSLWWLNNASGELLLSVLSMSSVWQEQFLFIEEFRTSWTTNRSELVTRIEVVARGCDELSP